jgi:ABC-type transport system involved in multi-copper enzyme maturation permease subunit
MIRTQHLIARTIFTEALRRREIYVIVMVTLVLLLAASTLRFFDLTGIHKFYHEVALKVMSIATVLTVIVLGARQLPREFENRTIYTMMAKPIRRWEFMFGKYLGVVAAGVFCLVLFMTVFLAGSWLNDSIPGIRIFLQYILLQVELVAVMAALSFMLSMMINLDAAITLSSLIYLLGHVLTNAMTLIYDFTSGRGHLLLKLMNYLVPQPALFDLSAKVVHGWDPVGMEIVGLTVIYALMFILPSLGFSLFMFQRRAL